MISLDCICDSIAGAVSGVTYILSSQPFDTIKVRMQMINSNTSAIKTASLIFRHEGPLSFYKGVVPPLLFSLPICSLLFAAYEQYMRYFQVDRQSLQYLHCIFIKQVGIAGGAYTGFIQSFLTSPSELFKIVFQMQIENNPKKYTSLYKCVRDYIQKEGIRSLFKGSVPTMFRDVPQYAIYFLTFEYLKNRIMVANDNEELSFMQQFVAGCASGLSCIIVSYPQDVIKTQIQNELTQQKKIFTPTFMDGGIMKCSKSVYRKNGIKGFWVGFNSCAVYYIVAGGAQLAGYEQTKLLLNYYVKY